MSGSQLIDQPGAGSEPALNSASTQVSAPPSNPSPLSAPKSEDPHSRLPSSVEEYKMFITLVFGVSIFGASTFAVAIGQMTDPVDIWKPNQAPFSMHRVRTFLGSAWLCFILAIAVAGYSSSLLTLLKRRADGVYDSSWTFLFLSLAMVPYAVVPGWIAVGACCFFGLCTMAMLLFQIRAHLDGK
ncbi:hypothetical protein FALBO_10413 [Fusarium albosuccineum]|uniref:Transmembrane protein n=1 Tax=Fusarium albosuccineum TaxID=1237068 RepID=A0A8H4L7S9_9HYPO|nr:hypothetical protein FALBO_10413 [Fusarium albosuccineum]